MHVKGHVFRRGVDTFQHRIVIQIAVIQAVQQLAQHRLRQTDIDQQLMMIQFRGAEFRLDRIGRAVQPLRRPELLALERVGDHDVVADGQTEHLLGPMGDDMAQTARRQNPRHRGRQILEPGRSFKQKIVGRIVQQIEGERQPLGICPPPPHHWGDGTDLRRDQP